MSNDPTWTHHNTDGEPLVEITPSIAATGPQVKCTVPDLTLVDAVEAINANGTMYCPDKGKDCPHQNERLRLGFASLIEVHESRYCEECECPMVVEWNEIEQPDSPDECGGDGGHWRFCESVPDPKAQAGSGGQLAIEQHTETGTYRKRPMQEVAADAE